MDLLKAIGELVGGDEKWFTLTGVRVRVAERLGGYVLELEGPTIDEDLTEMQKNQQIAQVISVNGVAHPLGRIDWAIAVRIDDEGIHVAANAPAEAVEEIAPKLRGAVAP